MRKKLANRKQKKTIFNLTKQTTLDAGDAWDAWDAGDEADEVLEAAIAICLTYPLAVLSGDNRSPALCGVDSI